MKTIFFVSAIRSPDRMATSTNIMTNNLLRGIKENGNRLVFLAICEHPEESSEVKEYYSAYADTVVPLSSRIGYGNNKYKQLWKMLYSSIAIGYYRERIRSAVKEISLTPDLIISHSPSIESICYSRALMEVIGSVPYYQYWSDPIALSCIIPEQLGPKRYIFKAIEHRALRFCDRIIYGTKTLMQFQKDLFPDHSDKMRYVDIAYIESDAVHGTPKKNSLLYAGNYFSKIRNIEPLVKAVSEMPEYTLDVFGEGDCSFRPKNNVVFHERISPSELSQKETEYECIVCIMNHSCIQIPGKIFYDMMKPCNILVITDGPHGDKISEYLKSFRRFVFCKNTDQAVKEAIKTIHSGDVSLERIKSYYSPRMIAQHLVSGGLKE